MNHNDAGGNSGHDLERVVDRACREFELAFRRSPDFRIEHWMGDFPRWLAQVQTSLDQDHVRGAIVSELIFVEMDMRRAVGQDVSEEEYQRRFPDFAAVIRESLEHQRNRIRLPPDFSVRDTADGEGSAREHESSSGSFELQPDLEPPRIVTIPRELGHYREIVEIKSGGFGIVCRAVDRRDGRVVALKFPRPDKLTSRRQLKAFLAEAQKAMLLDHPGIVRTYSIEQSQGHLAIVQQYIDGLDLRATITQPRNQKEIAQLIEQIADAIGHAHSQGIYHRDLKPSNILLDRQGQPYVADFGLALNEREQLHSPKQLCGTAQYMPPEQAAGLTRLLDGRSDLWSLGVIFYELLTRRRPFEGATMADIFQQIENKDPRPPRQIDPSIDRELQRICLKCLERQQRDRYPTADELAEDLRHWAGPAPAEASPSDHSGQVIPKGLRSYSAEDAAFFLDLLPGPRDRNGIPGSIRFWLSRIVEPVAQEARVPVGVIFGPSGSGKSSFIKAGLLPQLGRDVLTVYVEATQADTEVRLLKALRRRLVGIPDDISLADLFRGLSERQWLPRTVQKLLIVIDQFEQRLSQGDDPRLSQLARALRYCDGQYLQCLLLTRDDFMMALSRFADALELDLREGENAQAIDLFDKKHARKVLTELGRAYGQLPPEPTALSEDQESFVREAVDQLADHDHVICVHLALFAEMFRERDWTPAELKQVGGVAGTGEQFLEATFGPGSRYKFYRVQREPAQRVLETLLPASGIDIRGAMKPEHDLISAAKLQNHPTQFDELLKVLDHQLKLITRTDPDLPHAADSRSPETASTDGWYQLTHDYLVPSVRSWLDNSLGMTRAGRARLRLRNLGAQVVPGQPPQNLPTNLEWLAWQFQIPRGGLSESEQTVMQAARRRFTRQAGAVATILFFIGSLVALSLYQSARKERVREVTGWIDALIHIQEISRAPEMVNRLRPYASIAEPLLRKIVHDPARPPREVVRASMGLLPYDSGYSTTLIDAITRPECTPQELIALTDVLSSCGFSDFQQLSELVNAQASPPASRFRALCADIILRDGQGDWAQYSGLAANVLWDEPLTSVHRWIGILEPVGGQMLPVFRQIFGEVDGANKSAVLAQALFKFLPPEDRIGQLASLVGGAAESHFVAILAAIEENNAVDPFATALETTIAGDLDEVAQANVSIALARLGREEQLVQRLAGEFQLPSTIFAINLATSRRIRLHSLRQLYEQHSVSTTDDVNLRRSILQALALQTVDVFDSELRRWLEETGRFHAANDLDACCFSTAELILSRLGIDSTEEWRSARCNRPESIDGIYGNVLIDSQGRAFSVFEQVDKEGRPQRFAIATTEVTNRDIFPFRSAGQTGLALTNPKLPYEPQGHNAQRTIYAFCNWLSDENGLHEENCYPHEISVTQLPTIAADVQRLGYRIPTVDEWIYANESSRVFERMSKTLGSPVLNYAWVFENARSELHAVAAHLPNAAGLFDSLGNVQEICQSTAGDEPEFFEMGQSVRQEASVLSINAGKWPVEATATVRTKQGLRLARTLRSP